MVSHYFRRGRWHFSSGFSRGVLQFHGLHEYRTKDTVDSSGAVSTTAQERQADQSLNTEITRGLRAIIGRVQRRLKLYRNVMLHRKPLITKPDKGIISFTFDDFPSSAYRLGGRILSSHGAQGTYYVSLGFMGQSRDGLALFTEQDLYDLLRDGHELGCHTYSHTRCSAISAEELEREIASNYRAYTELVSHGAFKTKFRNFAYPYGDVAPRAKQTIKQAFLSGRGTKSGLNSRVMDLAFLRANRLYSDSIPLERIMKLIEQNENRPAWLIFYTHDVSDNPTSHGCTPKYLEEVVKAASSSRCRVLNVRDALGLLS
jgi:peptidoglycan/xylan/chitin deacetylase (PgdA/CDA1 family)